MPRRAAVAQAHVGDLGHGHQLFLGVDHVHRAGAEGAAKLDHPGPGGGVGQAGGQEADVHVGGGHALVRTGQGQDGEGGGGVGQGHQDAAVERLEDAVIVLTARDGDLEAAGADLAHPHFQGVVDGYALDARQNGLDRGREHGGLSKNFK